jgi:hypothetical protein
MREIPKRLLAACRFIYRRDFTIISFDLDEKSEVRSPGHLAHNPDFACMEEAGYRFKVIRLENIHLYVY